MSLRYCIVNADDFGASEGINRGVLEAHERGILTSASLMVERRAAASAAAAARARPALGLGLHFELEAQTGSADAARRALEAQLSRFEALVGASPTHLDVHHNRHRDPVLAPCFVAVAERHGLPLREHGRVHYFSRFYGRWDGQSHPEQLSVERLLAMLAHEVEGPIGELACHPGYRDPAFRSDYDAEREVELHTLCDPALRAGVARLGIRLVNHRDVAELPA